jgi:hypothetical protein
MVHPREITAPPGPRSSRRTGTRLGALALGLSALCAPALAFADEAQVDSGFALEATLGARYGVFATAAGADVTGNGLQTGLFGGYKLGRIVVGLGLEFTNGTTNATQMGGTQTITTTTSDSRFLIGPEFQASLLRTADGKVELIGDLALHFGHEFQSISVTPQPPVTVNVATDSNFLLSYAVGPGVRFWAHPHLALQALAGFGGEAYFDLPVNNNPATGNHSEHGIFSSFGLLGVF